MSDKIRKGGAAGYTLGAAAVLGVGFLLGILFMSYRATSVSPTGGPEHPAYTRPQLTELILGKTRDEVANLLGPPATTSEDRDAEYWHYRRYTQDPQTGKPDSNVQVVFREGIVEAVNY